MEIHHFSHSGRGEQCFNREFASKSVATVQPMALPTYLGPKLSPRSGPNCPFSYNPTKGLKLWIQLWPQSLVQAMSWTWVRSSMWDAALHYSLHILTKVFYAHIYCHVFLGTLTALCVCLLHDPATNKHTIRDWCIAELPWATFWCNS